MNNHLFFKFYIFGLLGLSLGVFGCSSNGGTDQNTVSQDETTEIKNTYTPETFQKDIEDLEGKVANPDSPQHELLARQLIDFYETYARIFSTDKMAPEMLFRAGNQAVNLEDYSLALTFYSKVENGYRAYQKRPECLFLQGFVYESYLDELGKAKEKYQKLIDQYPKHALALQSEESIKYLGVSDEERVRQFEKNN